MVGNIVTTAQGHTPIDDRRPFGSPINLAHLPAAFYPWLIATLLAYGALTQFVKTRYMRRFHAWL
jgi:Mg2+-importing ATPase